MTYQRVLLRLMSSGWLHGYLRDRVWRVESGEGAGLRLKLPQNLDYIAGSSELPVQYAVARNLRAGGVFYDIGANMGFFSLIAARILGPEGLVCAFEPLSENAAIVRANAELNAFSHLRTFEVAVGRSSRTDELLLTGWDGGCAVSSSIVKPACPTSTRPVRVVALDDFIPAEKLRLPTFVKIDVEGLELEVIQGMKNIIAEARPVLLYEIDDGDKTAFERRWKELDELVASLGYGVVHLENSYANIQWNVGHSLAVPSARPVR